MNAPEPIMSWEAANQRLLACEFARLKRRLAGSDEVACRAEIDAARSALPMPAAIDTVCEAFGLSVFERDILLLVAGIEMDTQLASLCSEAQGQLHRPWATFGLALAVLADPHWSALAPLRPLRRWRLIEVDGGEPLTSARLRIDERVLHHLAGLDFIDPRLAPMLRPVADTPLIAPSQLNLAHAVAGALEASQASLPLVQLHGDDMPGREDVAARVATLMGWRLLALNVEALPTSSNEVDVLVALWEREALLGSNGLFVECGEEPAPVALRSLLERVNGLVFIAAGTVTLFRRPSNSYEVCRPRAAERRQLWCEALGEVASGREAELDAVATQFRWSARHIAETGAALGADAFEDGALWRACRAGTPTRLCDLAQRVEASADWNDLVLPQPQMQTLAQIVVHMQQRFKVHDTWGFGGKGPRGLGITALFAGDSGTGKTLAAEVLARTLNLELFRIDLSAVVSKYIGETEKNLKRVFDAAEESGAMLLFDEADALFGKRSDVKDSHDRYANIEVSYLLQRMESYRGLAILTTNHKSALDPAFMRRLRFVLHFPFPEAAEREAIWRRAFPAATPTCELAFAKLARLQVAGGQIQNIALGAAFHAADAGEPVSMAHVLRAAHAESGKRERAISDGETRGWV
ncbi:MAG: ATP-binding protein [Bacteriovorax sp.]|nr:ATP-binding protein [Rhizobacter sp.]